MNQEQLQPWSFIFYAERWRRHQFLDYSACAPEPDQKKKWVHQTRQNSEDRSGGGAVAAELSTVEHEGHDGRHWLVRGDSVHHCEGGPWLQVVHL